MAVRLPVVLSQTTSRSPRQLSIEEDWITHLLFESGLDATLISNLSTIEKESTDQLCLEGIKGDFLLMSWLDKITTEGELNRLLGDPIRLVPINSIDDEEHTPSSISMAAASPTLPPRTVNIGERLKKVYFYYLKDNDDRNLGRTKIQELFKSLSTPVFQLGLTKTAKVASTSDNSSKPNGAAAGLISGLAEVVAHKSLPAEIHQRDVQDVTTDKSTDQSTLLATVKNSDLPDIDALVDELNDLDI